MEKKTVSVKMLTLLLTSMLTLAFNLQLAKASGTIYIRADGSVDPPTAPIQRDGDLYTFTGNIPDSIVVERDNIVVDGAGYTLQGIGAFDSRGIDLWHRNNVTIKNMKIKAFHYGIRFDSSNNSAYGNNITNNEYGIFLTGSTNNISGNNITNNYEGIRLDSSPNNSISGNNITNNYRGILLYSSLNNSISGNNIAANNQYGIFLFSSLDNIISGNNVTATNWIGILLYSSSSNSIYHNNLANTYQVFTYESVNVWDDGYPSGGNYWSDYSGVDTDGDGIGDTPYYIDPNNQDNYPLMEPWSTSTMIKTQIRTVKFWNLQRGIEKSLTSKLEGALYRLDMGNRNAAAQQLKAFINQVEALRNEKFAIEQADLLIAEVQRIIDDLERHNLCIEDCFIRHKSWLDSFI